MAFFANPQPPSKGGVRMRSGGRATGAAPRGRVRTGSTPRTSIPRRQSTGRESTGREPTRRESGEANEGNWSTRAVRGAPVRRVSQPRKRSNASSPGTPKRKGSGKRAYYNRMTLAQFAELYNTLEELRKLDVENAESVDRGHVVSSGREKTCYRILKSFGVSKIENIEDEIKSVTAKELEIRTTALKDKDEPHDALVNCSKALFKTDDLMSLSLNDYYLLTEVTSHNAFSPVLHSNNVEATRKMSSVSENSKVSLPSAESSSKLSFTTHKATSCVFADSNYVVCHVHNLFANGSNVAVLKNICDVAGYLFRRVLVVPQELTSITLIEYLSSFMNYRKYGISVVVLNVSLADPQTLGLCRYLQKVRNNVNFVLNFNNPIAPLICYPHCMYLQTVDDAALKSMSAASLVVDTKALNKLRNEARKGRSFRAIESIPQQPAVEIVTSHPLCKEVSTDSKKKLFDAMHNGRYEEVALAMSVLPVGVLRGFCSEMLVVVVDALADRSVPQQQRGHALRVLLFLMREVGSPRHGSVLESIEEAKETLPIADVAQCRYNLLQHGHAANDHNYDLSKMRLIKVGTTVENIVALCRALERTAPVLVEGATGLGKTASVCDACAVLGRKYVRFNLSAGVTVDDILGRVQLNPDSRGLTSYTDAYVNGHVLVLDECNLAQEEVLSLIEGSLDTGELVTNTTHLVRHKDFRLVITQNPTAGMFSGKREKLSDAFLSRFRRVQLSHLTRCELDIIVRSLLNVEQSDKDGANMCENIVCMHLAMEKVMLEEDNPLSVVTLRDLLFLCTSKTGLLYRAYVIYCGRVLSPTIKALCLKVIEKYLSNGRRGATSLPNIKGYPAVGTMGNNGCIATVRVHNLWRCLDVAMGMGRPVLVVGEDGCGKSCAVKAFALHAASKRGQGGTVAVNVTEDTDAGQLIGQYTPTKDGEGDDVVRWVDGAVVRAMKTGRILLLDDILAAPPVVVERLNSVLEATPELLISENDADAHITAKQGFQVLATGNIGAIKNISPALANRFVVVVMDSLTPSSMPHEINTLLEGSGFKGKDLDSAAQFCQVLCKDQLDIRSITRVLKKADTLDALKKAAISMYSGGSWFGLSNSKLPPSLLYPQKSVSWCLESHIPVLLIDERSEWDVGSLLDREHANILCTSLSQVAEWWDVTLPKSRGVMKISGPLHDAVTEGCPLLLQDYHNLSHCQMAELSALLDGREREGVACHEKFSVVATCTLQGLRTIPERWRRMFHEIVLPQPTAGDYKHYLSSAGMDDAIREVSEAAARLRDVVPIKMNLELYNKTNKRVKLFMGNNYTLENWGLVLASLFSTYPNITGILQHNSVLTDSVLKRLSATPSITREGTMISFSGQGLRSKVNVPSRGDDSRFALFVMSLPQPVIAAVVAMAHAVCAGETLVLAGPSGYKSFATEAYFSIIEGEHEVVHMTCATDSHELLGRISPFNRQDFEENVNKEVALVSGKTGDNINEYVESLRKAVEETKGTSTVFACKDGAVTAAIKTGRGVVYEHANLAGQNVPRAMTDCLVSRKLHLGIVPGSGRSHLSFSVPQVMIYSCARTTTHPPGYTQLTVYNCNPYTEDEVKTVLMTSLNHGTDEEKDELTTAMYKLCPSQSLRSAIRWVTFVNNYPVTTLSQKQVLICGYEMLFKKNDAKRGKLDYLAELGWDNVAIEAPSPRSLHTMHGRIHCLWNLTNLADVESKLKDCVLSKSLCKNLARVLAASTLSIPLLLEGSPGIGKGFVVEQAASLVGAEFKRIQMSSGTTVEQLFGTTMPMVKEGKHVFEFRDGAISAVLKKTSNTWVLLDELNLAPFEVQQALIPILSSGSPRVRFFSAVNPVEVGGGRTYIPASLKEYFAIITLAELDKMEVLDVGRAKLAKAYLPEKQVGEILCVYEMVREAVQKKKVGEGDELFNIRTLEKVALLMEASKLDPAKNEGDFLRYCLKVLDVVFGCGFSSKSDRTKVAEIIREAAPSLTEGVEVSGGDIEIKDNVVNFDGVKFERGVVGAEKGCAMSSEMKRRLILLSVASSSSLCVLLEGPTASGKTYLVKEYARICGRELKVITMTPNIEGSDLIGSWTPFKYSERSVFNELLILSMQTDDTQVMKALKSALEEPSREALSGLCDAVAKISDVKSKEAQRVKDLITKVGEGICFRFTMSRLLKATLNGEWVLLDNADWAPQEALERLNSLLEANSSLSLLEINGEERTLLKGDGIHPGFRLFMTTNPERKHATRMSQALQNRVIKINLQGMSPVHMMTGPTKHEQVALTFYKHVQIKQSMTCRSVLRSLSSWSETHDLAVLCDSLILDHTPALPDVKTAQSAHGEALRNILSDLYTFDSDDEDDCGVDDEAEESENINRPVERVQSTGLPVHSVSDWMDPEMEMPGIHGGEEQVTAVDGLDLVSEWNISNLKEASTSGLDSRNADFIVSHSKEGLLSFGQTLASLWRCKAGGVIEELVNNLVSPEGYNKLDIISKVCAQLDESLAGSYPNLTPIHLLVMKIYTMEGPDVDRMMGFQNVPVFVKDPEGWKAYKQQFKGKRNSQVYTEINTSIRVIHTAGSGVEKVEAHALFEKWVKFASVLICIGDVMTPTTLFRSVKGLSSSTVQKYRGMKQGDFEGWAAPTSTSRKIGVDKAFVGDRDDSVKFRIHNVTRGVYLKAVSAYPEEEEVLLPPFTSLEVIAVGEADGITTVDFKCTGSVCWDNPHLRGLLLQAVNDARDSNRRLRKMNGEPQEEEVKLKEFKYEPLVPIEDAPVKQGKVFCTQDTIKLDYTVPMEASQLLPTGKKHLDSLRSTLAQVLPELDDGWNMLTSGLKPSIKDAVQGFERLLTPNAFTRMQASSHGTSLYIPGLIKAITTNFTYNKVFASKTAGGKRNYSVVVAFDALLSKKGTPVVHYQLVDVIVRALGALDVPCTVVVYNSEDIFIVKTADDKWDRTAVTAFRLAAARFVEGENSHGWKTACKIALEVHALRRYAFVLSEGSTPWSDPEVTSAIASAASSGVHVVGLGTDLSIHSAFPTSLSLPGHAMLGAALMKHAEGEVEHPSVNEAKPQKAHTQREITQLREVLAAKEALLRSALGSQHNLLRSIRASDLQEISFLKTPPADLAKLISAIGILLGSKNKVNVAQILKFDTDSLTPEMIKSAVDLVRDVAMDRMKKISSGGAMLLEYLMLLENTTNARHELAAGKQELQAMEDQLLESTLKVKSHVAQGVALVEKHAADGSRTQYLKVAKSICDTQLLDRLAGTYLFPTATTMQNALLFETGPPVKEVSQDLLLEVCMRSGNIHKSADDKVCTVFKLSWEEWFPPWKSETGIAAVACVLLICCFESGATAQRHCT